MATTTTAPTTTTSTADPLIAALRANTKAPTNSNQGVTNWTGDATASDITGLYQNILGRAPDQEGLDFYDRSGMDRGEIARQLRGSDEFRGLNNPAVLTNTTPTGAGTNNSANVTTGNVVQTNTANVTGPDANADDITAIYESVLNRRPDAAGLQFYDDSGMSAAQIESQIRGSDEFVNLSPTSADDATADEISALYQELLGREADAEGLQWWDQTGDSVDEIRAGMMGSDEYKLRTSGDDATADEIAQLYLDVFGREADAEGLQWWDETGRSVDDIRNEFFVSPEYTNMRRQKR